MKHRCVDHDMIARGNNWLPFSNILTNFEDVFEGIVCGNGGDNDVEVSYLLLLYVIFIC